MTPRTEKQRGEVWALLLSAVSECGPGSRTDLDTDKRNDDLLQPLGVLALYRLLKERKHILEDLVHRDLPHQLGRRFMES